MENKSVFNDLGISARNNRQLRDLADFAIGNRSGRYAMQRLFASVEAANIHLKARAVGPEYTR